MTYSSPNVKFTGFGSGQGSSLERFDQSLDTQGSDAGNADQATTTGQTGSSFGANFGLTGPDWGWLARFGQPDYLDFNSGRPSNATSSQSTGASSTTEGGAASISSSAGVTSDTTQVVSMSGSGLVFDNTYDSSCTAAYEACIVAAEDQLESLFTNSDDDQCFFQRSQFEGTTASRSAIPLTAFLSAIRPCGPLFSPPRLATFYPRRILRGARTGTFPIPTRECSA